MLQVSPIKEKILRHLSEYKYLTVSHIIKLGVTESVQVCRRELRELRTRFRFTEKMTVASISESLGKRIEEKKIRQEDLHFLTERGANFLDEEARIDLRNIRYPKRTKTRLSNDYFHRVSSVFTHISYDKWIYNNDFTHSETLLYYDKRAKFKKLKTKIEARIKIGDGRTKTPDLVMGFKNEKSEGRVFIVEIYNGARPQYVYEQTKELVEVNTSELCVRVGIKKAPRILITCETTDRLNKAMERIKEDEFFNKTIFDKTLFFNTDRNVWNNFGKGWVNLQGEEISLEKL